MTLKMLSEVAEVIMGQSPPGSTYNSTGAGLPFFQGKSEFGKISPVAVKWCTEPTKIANAGDILISVRAPVGPTNLADQKCCIGRGLAAIRPNPNFVDRDFVWFYLQFSQKELEKKGQGSTFDAINGDDLNSIELPNIDLTNQRQIAARLKAQLAEVETARQAAQVQLREADALRAGIYREAFRSIVPVAVPPHFEDAPDGWRWYKLTDIAQLESGHTPSRHRPDWWGGDVSWISLTEIRALDGQWVESTQLRTNHEGIANSSARILPRGTVCYSRTASVGFVCIMAAPMSTSQDFANWVCGDELEPEFLMHALIRSRKELREIATGATHKTIYMPQLGSFHLCAPAIDDQRRIVMVLKKQLAEADALRTALEQQLSDLDALPQRILAQAFEN